MMAAPSPSWPATALLLTAGSIFDSWYKIRLSPLRGLDPDARLGAARPDQGSMDELEAAFLPEEAGYGVGPSPLFFRNSAPSVGAAQVFSMAPGHPQRLSRASRSSPSVCTGLEGLLPKRVNTSLAAASPVARVGASRMAVRCALPRAKDGRAPSMGSCACDGPGSSPASCQATPSSMARKSPKAPSLVTANGTGGPNRAGRKPGIKAFLSAQSQR